MHSPCDARNIQKCLPLFPAQGIHKRWVNFKKLTTRIAITISRLFPQDTLYSIYPLPVLLLHYGRPVYVQSVWCQKCLPLFSTQGIQKRGVKLVRISVVDVRAATSSPDQHLNWEEVWVWAWGTTRNVSLKPPQCGSSHTPVINGAHGLTLTRTKSRSVPLPTSIRYPNRY